MLSSTTLLRKIDDAILLIDRWNRKEDSTQADLRNTIIVINGTLGVGKTSTGDALNCMIKDSVFLDGDALYQHSTLDHANHPDWYFNWTAIVCANINLHLTAFKTTNFVISYVFEDDQCIADLVHAIRTRTEHKHARIYVFLLTADISVIHNRIRKRALHVSDADAKALQCDLDRSSELQSILLTHQRKAPHSLGQLVDTSECRSIKQAAEKIKDMVIRYDSNLHNWKRLLPRYLVPVSDRKGGRVAQHICECLEPLDFLSEFKEIIVTRKKSATTRWIQDEPLRVSLVAGKWMVATVDTGRQPFAIVHVNKVESYRLEELTDSIAKIENMKSAAALVGVLKQIYPTIKDNDTVQVIYFSCCHFVA